MTYVIGRTYWGPGIATAALAEPIGMEPARPLHADDAADNAGPIRVLEKCGFIVTRKNRCFAQLVTGAGLRERPVGVAAVGCGRAEGEVAVTGSRTGASGQRER
ncbi:hypothetical protein [Streptomyces sp. NPDC101234]|uniref:hypothetical protein n=1 Tax=Streptomyces sp. NPDC101234 TaxID=3366138 RepID=UPI0037FC88F7